MLTRVMLFLRTCRAFLPKCFVSPLQTSLTKPPGTPTPCAFQVHHWLPKRSEAFGVQTEERFELCVKTEACFTLGSGFLSPWLLTHQLIASPWIFKSEVFTKVVLWYKNTHLTQPLFCSQPIQHYKWVRRNQIKTAITWVSADNRLSDGDEGSQFFIYLYFNILRGFLPLVLTLVMKCRSYCLSEHSSPSYILCQAPWERTKPTLCPKTDLESWSIKLLFHHLAKDVLIPF